ncbi:HAMP domain-containing sensor histidine kinase [Enterococcus sp.]|jgi:two-component system sensor histidine kinase CiaH|uniref:sensor histidine kinase n=1 Tax=Enterococcus sp. TaxID=35783 RepID=UPI0025C4A219|nr:HAMP domain-containing sensor histidine kinase [Enterococcus sp.]
MNKELSKKQRLKVFLINVAAFALIFTLLGIIVLELFNQSAYQETDISLEQAAKDTRLIQAEINAYQNNTMSLPPDAAMPKIPGTNRFNTQLILWSEKGVILNKQSLGGRFSQLASLKLDTGHLNTIQSLTVTDQNEAETLLFRSITAVAPTNQSGVAYVQVLANTNQIDNAMKNFQTILVLSMVFFWILSIGISYYLSSLTMRPILASWKKQQEFVENASHELRTPLTIIQNSLERTFTKPNHTIIEESESIAQALAETRRLTGLTADLLTIARSDSNQQMLSKEPIAIAPFIQELAKPFQEIAKMDSKHFVLENLALTTAVFDPKKIHQILVILLDNALKYTSQGDKITLLSEISNKYWLLEVRNTGPSISDEDKKHIFERFYREDRSRSKETGGYGLGLAIAKQIVEEHKGQISVRDLQPKGVIFQIRLPKEG